MCEQQEKFIVKFVVSYHYSFTSSHLLLLLKLSIILRCDSLYLRPRLATNTPPGSTACFYLLYTSISSQLQVRMIKTPYLRPYILSLYTELQILRLQFW